MTTERRKAKPRLFPVIFPRDWEDEMKAAGVPRFIPWNVVADYERRAQTNHGQTLTRLAERGGLDPFEIHVLVNDLPLLKTKQAVEAAFHEGVFQDLVKRTLAFYEQHVPGIRPVLEQGRPIQLERWEALDLVFGFIMEIQELTSQCEEVRDHPESPRRIDTIFESLDVIQRKAKRAAEVLESIFPERGQEQP